MLDAVANVPQLTDLLTLLGSVGTVVGGTIGLVVPASTQRQRFESLALGAAAGGASGCLIAFIGYACLNSSPGATMRTMSHMIRVTTSLLAGCALIATSYALLAYLGAGSGWYYASGVCVTGLITYRVLVPALGVPTRPRWPADRGSDAEKTHFPHPHA